MVGEKKIRVLDLEENEDRNIPRERASRNEIEEEEGERDKRARENLLFFWIIEFVRRPIFVLSQSSGIDSYTTYCTHI